MPRCQDTSTLSALTASMTRDAAEYLLNAFLSPSVPAMPQDNVQMTVVFDG
jgi:hypothetical protein